jgi:hypothetical protein
MIELVEPKPLIGPRGLIVLTLGFLLVLIAIPYALAGVQHERILSECSDRGPGKPTSYSTTTDFKLPPERGLRLAERQWPCDRA